MNETTEEKLVPRGAGTTALARRADVQPVMTPWDEEEESINLRDYWRVVRKHRWLILTFLLTLVTAVTIYSFKATPIYQAKALIQIDKESPNVVSYKDFMAENADNEQVAVTTQMKVLQSRTLAHRVIDQLDLRHHPLFDPDRVKSALALPGTASASTPSIATASDAAEEKQESVIVDSFLRQLEVKPVRGSRVIEVNFSSPDPQLAARINNAIITSFIDLNMESRYDATMKASDWLLKQSVDLKARVEKSEESLVEYARTNGIISVDDKQNVVTQKLSDLNEALTKAQAERMDKEAMYRQIHSGGGVDVNLIRDNSLIKTLSERQSDLERQYADLTAKFEPGWPAAQQIKSQIDEVKRQLAAETQRLFKGIDADFLTAQKREQLLQQALDQQKTEANALNEKSIQYNILKREVDTNKQLYEGLLQRLKEAGVSAGLKSSNIRIVDVAEVPKFPIRPKKAMYILLSLVVGLMLGVGLAFVLEYVDNTITTPDEVERLLRLPSLALVPALGSTEQRKKLTGGRGLPDKTLDLEEQRHSLDLISQTQVKSIVSEAYRTLRTSVLLSSNSHPPKTLLITSAGPGEGKTSTAVNLGITLAQLGSRVLIIDCDMRRPRIHRVFKTPPENTGLSSYLSGNSKLVPLIVETDVPNLYVVPAGITPPNPSELIGSDTMRQSLELLVGHFDHVVLDSPPVMSVTDTTILSTLVDGVIFVIQGGTTNRNAAARAAQRLRDVGARIFGTVLNNVDVKSADYDYYYHQYYYYSYYTDEKGKGRKSV